jgi:regulator of cell morphogenesis and NO signaling
VGPDSCIRQLGMNDAHTNSEDLVELVDRIVSNHHTFTRSELSRLGALAQAVARERAGAQAELVQLEDLVGQLASDLLAHMEREEQILFPYIVALEASTHGAPPMRSPFGSVTQPIARMLRDHETARILLQSIRTTTRDLRLPPDASDAQRALYEGLATLEGDLETHMRLESDELFVRATALEGRAA